MKIKHYSQMNQSQYTEVHLQLIKSSLRQSCNYRIQYNSPTPPNSMVAWHSRGQHSFPVSSLLCANSQLPSLVLYSTFMLHNNQVSGWIARYPLLVLWPWILCKCHLFSPFLPLVFCQEFIIIIRIIIIITINISQYKLLIETPNSCQASLFINGRKSSLTSYATTINDLRQNQLFIQGVFHESNE